MLRRFTSAAFGGLLLCVPAAAHHGWGSYDSTRPLTLEGTVAAISADNPHAELRLEVDGRTWLVTLSPPSRMANRGKPATDIAVGDTVKVAGFPSKDAADEMRAEEISHGGTTINLR